LTIRQKELYSYGDKRPESPKPIDPEKLDAIILKIIVIIQLTIRLKGDEIEG
jgi:hypothetical protein